MEPEKARRREEELWRHFPEARVEGFEPLIDVMTNDLKDRHVLAAAVRSHSELIVTYNRRDFPDASVRPWEIEVQGPSTFLRGIYDLEPGLFVHKLHEQAGAIGLTLQRLLERLSKNVPGFVQYFCEEQGVNLPRRLHDLAPRRVYPNLCDHVPATTIVLGAKIRLDCTTRRVDNV